MSKLLSCVILNLLLRYESAMDLSSRFLDPMRSSNVVYEWFPIIYPNSVHPYLDLYAIMFLSLCIFNLI